MKHLLVTFLTFFFLTTPLLADQSTPDGTVRAFYDWYQKAGDRYRDSFSAAKPLLTDELYQLLARGFQQSHEEEFWVDFDPFVNAQMNAERFSFESSRSVGPDLALIVVTPTFGEGVGSVGPIKVYLRRSGGQWRIANMVYGGDYPFELKTYLKDGLGI